MTTWTHAEIGALGEQLAVDHLTSLGLAVLDRNWRCRYGELDIIAAVVLGGASIFGGRGSVLGTVLGVVLVQLINNNLVLLGVPSTWQRAAVGILLLAGVGVQAVDASRRRKRPAAVLDGAA